MPCGADALRPFRKSLGIAPTMLTGRLSTLVDEGLLEKRRYLYRPPRDEYLLTKPGATSCRSSLRLARGDASIAAEAG
jgi:DNA-binding HxlR family transcriptional regulator